MNCLLLGGTGFIGKNLCEGLTAQGHNVFLTSRDPYPHKHITDYYRYYHLSLVENFNPHEFKKILSDVDVIIQLITTTTPKSSNVDPVYDVMSNVTTTLKVLECAREVGIKKIIFLSSGGTIYGQPKMTPIAEDHPTEPLCSYGITKKTIEQYLFLYEHLYNLQYVTLRVSNPYGKYQLHNRSQGVIPTFLNNTLSRQNIPVWGDGEIVRDYIYISDVVDAIIKSLTYEGSERIFNIGSGTGYSLNNIMSEIEKLVGHPIDRQYSAGRIFDVK